MRSPALLAALLLAALLALAPPSLAAGDPCESNPLACDFDQDSTFAAALQAEQINALLPVKDGPEALRHYRNLLPAPYTMPAEPAVGLWLAEVYAPARQTPFVTWIEGSLALRARHGDEEGWYMLANPTNSGSAYDLGRAAGWPKYMAATDMGADGEGWTGTVSVGGVEAMSLEWTPAAGATGDEALTDWTFKRGPFLSLNAPHEGPDAVRTKFTLQPTPVVSPAPETGVVAYRVDPDLDRLDSESPDPLPELMKERQADLTQIIDVSGTVAGQLHEPTGNVLLQSKGLGEGGYGPVEPAPAEQPGDGDGTSGGSASDGGAATGGSASDGGATTADSARPGGGTPTAPAPAAPAPSSGLPRDTTFCTPRSAAKLRLPRGARRVLANAGGRRLPVRVRGRSARVDLRSAAGADVRVTGRTRSGRRFARTIRSCA